MITFGNFRSVSRMADVFPEPAVPMTEKAGGVLIRSFRREHMAVDTVCPSRTISAVFPVSASLYSRLA